MKIERLNELKEYAEKQIELGKDFDMRYYDYRSLVINEINRINGRRKTPLLPCKCGNKRISQYRGIGYVRYKCEKCGERPEVLAFSDRDARLNWNFMIEKQKEGRV